MTKNRFFTIFCFLLAFSFFSCKTNSNLVNQNQDLLDISELCPENPEWQNLIIDEKENSDFQHTGFYISKLNVEWYCFKINLDAKNLQLIYEPMSKEGKTYRLKTFSTQNNAIAAINTQPFKKKMGKSFPINCLKADGKIIFPVNSRYSALAFNFNPLRAYVIKNQTEEEISNYDFVTGGYFTIVKDGEILPYKRIRAARSAAATSNQGSFLYFFATCGKNFTGSNSGLTYEECALILKKLGADQALQFDGGHSTGLNIQGQDIIRPNFQRKVPSLMAFKFSDLSK